MQVILQARTFLIVCGRCLFAVFAVFVLSGLLPFNIKSSVWGSALSSRIVDTASLPLVGTALIFAAAFMLVEPSSNLDSDTVRKLFRYSSFPLKMCRLGTILLLLLALWQVPLMRSNISIVNQKSISQIYQVTNPLPEAKQSIENLPPEEIERRWSQAVASRPELSQNTQKNLRDKRNDLIRGLDEQERGFKTNILIDARQSKMAIYLESIRVIFLCIIYAAGFHLMSKSLRTLAKRQLAKV